MAFILPTFNMEASIHTWQQNPWPWPERLRTICQLRAPDMANAALFAGSGTIPTGMVLIVPAGTDLRDFWTAPGTHPDAVECPPGSGRVYQITYSDDVAKGFDNEHRFAIMKKGIANWPTEMP